MTNNPDKVAALEDYGLAVIERVPIETMPRLANRGYLETKRSKFGHLLSLITEGSGAQKDAERQVTAGEKKRN
ncbi:Riboflavin biosynthesis protein RibBA [compost metagenome]